MKKAFTMLELIFVIVVIGILAATIIPNTKRNPLQEAAVQVASHIKYTQHLAMTDDKYNAIDNQWYKDRWQILFGKNDNSNQEVGYTIFSDRSGGSTGEPNESEIALNPEDLNQLMTGGTTGANKLDIRHDNFRGMKKLNLGITYDVSSYNLSCGNARISFDHLGRPFSGDHSSMINPYNAGKTQRLLETPCIITLRNGSEYARISVEPETGFTCILNESDECQ